MCRVDKLEKVLRCALRRRCRGSALIAALNIGLLGDDVTWIKNMQTVVQMGDDKRATALDISSVALCIRVLISCRRSSQRVNLSVQRPQ